MFSNRNCWRSMFEPSWIPFCRVVYVFELNSDCRLLSDLSRSEFRSVKHCNVSWGLTRCSPSFREPRSLFFARSDGCTGFATMSGLSKLCLKMIMVWFFSGLFVVEFCMCLVGSLVCCMMIPWGTEQWLQNFAWPFFLRNSTYQRFDI